MKLQHNREEALGAVRYNLSSDLGSAGSNLARDSKEAFGSVSDDAPVLKEQMLINSDLRKVEPESNGFVTSLRSHSLRQSNAVSPTVAQIPWNKKEVHETPTDWYVSSRTLGMTLTVDGRSSDMQPAAMSESVECAHELNKTKWTVSGMVHTSRWMLQDLVQHIETITAAHCRDRDGESAAETAGLTWTSMLTQLWVSLSARLEHREQRCSFLQRARSKAVAGKLLLGRSPSSTWLPRWYRLTS